MQSLRYAPSPTGRLHLGNLRTAYVSYQIAKILGLSWQIRFEDIDRLRVLAGAANEQLKDLKSLGLVAEKTYLQSDNHALHFETFLKARAAGLVFPCFCSRKDNESSAPHSPGAKYSGACRDLKAMPNAKNLAGKSSVAWRLWVNDLVIGRSSLIQNLSQRVEADDFQSAYHWACALDDVTQNHSVIVRGADLAAARFDQSEIYKIASDLKVSKYLYQPTFVHTRMVVGVQGERLEKRSRGVTLQELLTAGVRMDLVCERFETSLNADFMAQVRVLSAAVFDEPGQALSIQEMGF